VLFRKPGKKLQLYAAEYRRRKHTLIKVNGKVTKTVTQGIYSLDSIWGSFSKLKVICIRIVGEKMNSLFRQYTMRKLQWVVLLRQSPIHPKR